MYACRWSMNEHYSSNIEDLGMMYVREGGFIDNVDMFDCDMFGISTAEICEMDPQQRQVLEVSYEALLYSGRSKLDLKKSDIGVFVGCCTHEWYDHRNY